ncbi:hypothetical protein SAMN05216573_11011 [Bradyrhizobium sp. Rc3b]|nr:hypothetical protein [Bradyrhizobium sp. SBR1B]SFN23813.1 hypothetical protein SAMN05216573_11011 [Bradyrhizobium sp. Rc3b]
MSRKSRLGPDELKPLKAYGLKPYVRSVRRGQ